MSSHPCEDPIEDLAPCQGRPAPPFLPGVIIRSEEGAGAGLVLLDPEAVGSFPERLRMFSFESRVSRSQVGEPAHYLGRHGGRETLAANQGFEAIKLLNMGEVTSEGFHRAGRSKFPSGGPNQPQGNSNRSARSPGVIVIKEQELTRPTGHGAN